MQIPLDGVMVSKTFKDLDVGDTSLSRMVGIFERLEIFSFDSCCGAL